MRLLRLAILGDSPCDQCTAACCRQNGHAYAVLLEGDERRKFAPWAQDVPVWRGDVVVAERVLPYRDGRCVFLGGDDRCTIYQDRPVNCRRFQCVTGYRPGGSDPAGHGAFLRANPAVVRLLDALEPGFPPEFGTGPLERLPQDMV
jgi:Fe-S-cluster containining protein